MRGLDYLKQLVHRLCRKPGSARGYQGSGYTVADVENRLMTLQALRAQTLWVRILQHMRDGVGYDPERVVARPDLYNATERRAARIVLEERGGYINQDMGGVGDDG